MDWSPSTFALDPIYDPLIPLFVQIVGRERELDTLRHRLCSKRGELVALNGLPGVGKTTMAVALARDADIRMAFPDGILWVGLGTSPDVVSQLQRWAGLFRLFMPEIGEHAKEVIGHVIEDRQMLLIIDDVWNIEDALAFRLGGPRCTHLFTTRFPHLALKLSSGDPVHVQELNEEESLDLLHTLAPRIVEQEAEKARALVQTIGGLPLALSLIGNYLRTQTYGGQTRRIQAALAQLRSHETRLHLNKPLGPVERHPSLPPGQRLSLHSVIALSDAHMDNETRQAFYSLSVLPPKPDTFSEAATLAVCACPPSVLEGLQDTGLLERGGDGRYTLHQTVADYARLHLNNQLPQERLIAYALTFLQTHQIDYERLNREHAVLLMALEVAFSLNQKAELVQLACAFAPFLLLHGNYEQARLHLDRAQQAALALNDQQGLVEALLYLGELAEKQGDYDQSQALLEQGITLARSQNDSEHLCALLSLLGKAHWKQGRYEQAEEILQEGLALARQIEHTERLMSEMLATLGAVLACKGDYVLSEERLEEGLHLVRQIGDRERICRLLMNLGATITDRGRYEQAYAYFEEGLGIARQIGQYEWTSAFLSNLGAVATLMGNYVQAATYQREGLRIARKIGHHEWMSILLLNLGETAIAQGMDQQAELYFTETVKLAQQLARPRLIARALYELGNLYLKQEHIETAESTFHEVLRITPSGDTELQALAHYGLARAAVAQSNIDEAQQHGAISVAILEKMGHYKAQEVKDWLNSLMAL